MLKIEHVDVLFLESDTPGDKKEREHLAGINLCKDMICKYFGDEDPKFLLNDFGKPFVDYVTHALRSGFWRKCKAAFLDILYFAHNIKRKRINSK